MPKRIALAYPTGRIPHSRYEFDDKSNRHRDKKSGQYTSQRDIRAVIDADIEATKARMQKLGDDVKIAARQFQAGKITQRELNQTLAKLRTNLADEVVSLHLSYTAAARGGFRSLDSRTDKALKDALTYHLKAVDGLVQDLKKTPALIVGRVGKNQSMDERLGHFASAGRGTFEIVNEWQHRQAGYKLEQNIPHSNESCKGEGSCEEATDRGKVPIGTNKKPGYRICGPACECGTEYFME